jgi:hypothetical protein
MEAEMLDAVFWSVADILVREQVDKACHSVYLSVRIPFHSQPLICFFNFLPSQIFFFKKKNQTGRSVCEDLSRSKVTQVTDTALTRLLDTEAFTMFLNMLMGDDVGCAPVAVSVSILHARVVAVMLETEVFIFSCGQDVTERIVDGVLMDCALEMYTDLHSALFHRVRAFPPPHSVSLHPLR